MAAANEGVVERVVGLSYWRAAEAQVVVEACRRSGLSAAAFARRYGIRAERLRRWVRELEEEGRNDGALRFHPVRVVQRREEREESPPRRRPIEIVTRRGARVRVPAGFRAEDLERVLVVLGEGEGC
jgi:transposase-like protein